MRKTKMGLFYETLCSWFMLKKDTQTF